MSFDDRLHHLASGYVAAPQWIKNLVGGTYSLLPMSLRFGAPYAEFRLRFSRAAVDERAEWVRANGMLLESEPQEYTYFPGYYAVFFYDPDGMKLEILHVPALAGPGQSRGGRTVPPLWIGRTSTPPPPPPRTTGFVRAIRTACSRSSASST